MGDVPGSEEEGERWGIELIIGRGGRRLLLCEGAGRTKRYGRDHDSSIDCKDDVLSQVMIV